MNPKIHSKLHTNKQGIRTPQTNNGGFYCANLLDQISDALISTDMDFRIVEWNTAAENIYGWQAAEVHGHLSGEFLQTEYLGCTRDEVIQAVMEQGVWKGEATQNRKNGERFPVMASISIVKDQTGKPMGIVTINRDITERNQTQTAMRESERRLNNVIHSAMDAIISTDQDQRIIIFNEAAEEMFNCKASEALGQQLEFFIPSRFWEKHQGYVKGIGIDSQSALYRKKVHAMIGKRCNSEEFPAEASISYVESSNGKVYTAILRDVTERKNTDAAQQASEARFRTVFESSPVVVGIARMRDSVFVQINPAFTDLLGYTREQILGSTALAMDFWVRLEDRAGFAQIVKDVGRVRNFESLIRQRSGGEVPVLISASLIELDGEQCVLIQVVDLTDMKLTNQKLKANEQRLHLAATAGGVGFWDWDIATAIPNLKLGYGGSGAISKPSCMKLNKSSQDSKSMYRVKARKSSKNVFRAPKARRNR